MNKNKKIACLLSITLCSLWGIVPVSSQASTILLSEENEAKLQINTVAQLQRENVVVVTNNRDSGTGSLRDAVYNADPGTTIEFDPSLNNETIELEEGIWINKDLNFDGSRANNLTISGAGKTNIFWIGGTSAPINVDVSNLTLADAYYEEDAGGAIYGDVGTTLNINNVNFQNNVSDGGAIHAQQDSNISIRNSHFENNDGATISDKEYSTGAVSLFAFGSLDIADSTFVNNRGFNGGAIHVTSSDLNVKGSRFIGNDSTPGKNRDNYIPGAGGAIYADAATVPRDEKFYGLLPEHELEGEQKGGIISVEDSYFEGNRASGQGGALALWGYSQDEVFVTDNVIVDNEVILNKDNMAEGGGVWLMGYGTVENNTIANNRSEDKGGGLFIWGEVPTTVSNTTFSNNQAAKGGAIYNDIWDTQLDVENSIFEDNLAQEGSLIFNNNMLRPVNIENSQINNTEPSSENLVNLEAISSIQFTNSDIRENNSLDIADNSNEPPVLNETLENQLDRDESEREEAANLLPEENSQEMISDPFPDNGGTSNQNAISSQILEPASTDLEDIEGIKPTLLYKSTTPERRQIHDANSLDALEIIPKVVNDWGNVYELKLSIKAIEDVDNWGISAYLTNNHIIRENYGGLISGLGSDQGVNLIGEGWNHSLKAGEESEIFLIIEGETNEASISFDNYDATLGNPVYSSFTPADREFWAAQYPDSDQTLAANTEPVEENSTEIPPDRETPAVQLESNTDNTTPDTEFPLENLSDIEAGANDVFAETEPSEIETDSEQPTNSQIAMSQEELNNTIPESNSRETSNGSGDGGFRYGEALQKNFLFLMANRSGRVGSDNLLEWRSDSTLTDGADVGKDLSGGYFDAGDHIKFTQPMAYTITQLAWGGVDYRDAYQESGLLDELLNAVKWGTDYFIKCHEMSGGKTQRFWGQVGDGTDHNYWVSPEQISNSRPSFDLTPNKPGTDLAAGTASALAASSILFRGIDDAYASELLDHAIALFDFAETYLGKYSDSIPAASPFYTSWSGYEDELVTGAAWLYRATGDDQYLKKAEKYFRDGIGHIGTYTYATDDHSYGGLALLAYISDDPFFKQEFFNWATTWIDGTGGVNYTEGGMGVRAEWASAPLALSAAFLIEYYNDFIEPNQKFSEFAKGQTDYILGDNPIGLSYVIGFGDRYPVRPHHRGSAGSQQMDGSTSSAPNDNLLVGALVGGPRNTDYSHEDRRNDWVTNEVGTSYNAPLSGALIQQYDNYGGQPLSESQLSQIPGIK